MEQKQNGTDPDQVNTTALTVDPVITWLEQIRDFLGSTPQAKDMAQRAIDRIRPPAKDPWVIVGALVDDLGTLRSNNGVLISDRANQPASSSDDAGYYGGYLVAESIQPRQATAMAFLPQLLVAARDTSFGRSLLEQLAEALSTPTSKRDQVRDRLDGTMRLCALGQEFKYAGKAYDSSDPFYVVAIALGHLAAGLLGGSPTAAAVDILQAQLVEWRQAQPAAGTGAVS